jgi:hypothetical protein
MMNTNKKYFFLPAALMLALALVMPHAARAQAPADQTTAAPRPAQIDHNGMLMLIRSTLLALDQANKTGNYTVLRDLGAPAFQTNTAAQLATIFAKHRDMHLDLLGVAVVDPQMTLSPQIEANGMMRMDGVFQLGVSRVGFELFFMPVNNEWRLFGVAVDPGTSPTVNPAGGNANPQQKRGKSGR